MLTLASLLVAASGAIVAVFGALHALFTFRGPRLFPRDDALRARMHEVAPVITRETTMWKAWLGFNASHGLGLVLFGVLYAWLALGFAALCAWLLLAKLYFFSVPLRGVVAATVLYVVGVLASRYAG